MVHDLWTIKPLKVRFAVPKLGPSPSATYDEVKQFLRVELSQCGGVGCHTVSWQDVVTRIFQSTTHQVLQDQIQYVIQRLCWFLKKQKESVVAWMTTLEV